MFYLVCNNLFIKRIEYNGCVTLFHFVLFVTRIISVCFMFRPGLSGVALVSCLHDWQSYGGDRVK